MALARLGISIVAQWHTLWKMLELKVNDCQTLGHYHYISTNKLSPLQIEFYFVYASLLSIKQPPDHQRHANTNNDQYQRRSTVIQNLDFVLTENIMFDDCSHADLRLQKSILIAARRQSGMLTVTRSFKFVGIIKRVSVQNIWR